MSQYNLSLLKEQCGNDTVFYNEMLDIFVRSSLEGVVNMEEALIRNDYKTIGHYAHKIISPCRHIEADSLVDLLRDIESRAEKNELEPEAAKVLVSRVREEVNELAEQIKNEYVK
jgi:HPt (histidine-containing phosphotransfer) domain-containing protein